MPIFLPAKGDADSVYVGAKSIFRAAYSLPDFSAFSASSDYSVIYREDGGRELHVGRIFKGHGFVGGGGCWFWAVEFHQAKGRVVPFFGQVDTLEAAKAACRKCWDSADVPIRWPPSMA
jgi:hypothetical protein